MSLFGAVITEEKSMVKPSARSVLLIILAALVSLAVTIDVLSRRARVARTIKGLVVRHIGHRLKQDQSGKLFSEWLNDRGVFLAELKTVAYDRFLDQDFVLFPNRREEGQVWDGQYQQVVAFSIMRDPFKSYVSLQLVGRESNVAIPLNSDRSDTEDSLVEFFLMAESLWRSAYKGDRDTFSEIRERAKAMRTYGGIDMRGTAIRLSGEQLAELAEILSDRVLSEENGK